MSGSDDAVLDFDDGGNLQEVSVAELSAAIKRTVEDRFGLVRVRGEIGRVSRPSSGHMYLSLKDERAVIDGVIWRGVSKRFTVQPQEGLEVVVTGRLTTFPGQSKYQIVIESLAPAGVGALMAMLEARKKALAAEGLFDAGRKRALPYLPETIGVVTSPSGAVIRDILHRLADRFPVRVLVWPVAVQGEKCAPEVAAAIRGFNALSPGGPVPRPDLLIVARGGGSLEDLWGFNEETVARAAAESAIPLISAVGHETDVTLIDHASDLRAPTPSAAAEKAVPVRAELLARLAERAASRHRAMERLLRERRERLTRIARSMGRPEALIAERRQRLDLASTRLPQVLRELVAEQRIRLAEARSALSPSRRAAAFREARGALRALGSRLSPERLREAMVQRRQRVGETRVALSRAGGRGMQHRRERLVALTRTLEALSYRRVLERGYAVVRDSDGGIVSAPEGAPGGAALTLEFAAEPRVRVTVEGGGAAAPKRRRERPAKPSAPQLDLFGDG